ncbi:phosphotransferase [Streptomyces sp. BHT-5-2]|uniref:phosphotransferase n=1 Tax=Streptomyces sp. BHT-5-2 TaxID=2866715 RepID=UPI0021B10657|nr:phosphotransferase [Streptomyces sp. BHT-5-2]
MALIPTPELLWRKPPVLALAAVSGAALGRLGKPSIAPLAAWCRLTDAARRATAAMARFESRRDRIAPRRRGECEWLVTNGVLATPVDTQNRRVVEAALRPWTPVFTHGDLQVTHVFVDGDEITSVVDWSEADPGDALFGLATKHSDTRSTLTTTSPATAPTST